MDELIQAKLPDIIQRYAQGESVQTLAEESGVHRATLYRWMLAGTGDKAYYDLVTGCLVRRVADADYKLETATDPCDIARARETAKFARMDFERRRPALYANRTQIDVSVDIGSALAELSERLRVAQEQQIGHVADNASYVKCENETVIEQDALELAVPGAQNQISDGGK